MMLKLNLPPEKEARIRAVAAAEGKDVETFVTEIVDERLADEQVVEASETISFDEWLNGWIALHPQVTHFVDDSRESIYEGRGE
jgi:plasmid stability protein